MPTFTLYRLEAQLVEYYYQVEAANLPEAMRNVEQGKIIDGGPTKTEPAPYRRADWEWTRAEDASENPLPIEGACPSQWKYDPEQGEHRVFTQGFWREAVGHGYTHLGYEDWVNHRLEEGDEDDLLAAA